MSGSIRIHSLQRNLLHLTDGPAVVRNNAPLVNLADDEGCGLYAGHSVGKNDLAAVSDRLGTT